MIVKELARVQGLSEAIGGGVGAGKFASAEGTEDKSSCGARAVSSDDEKREKRDRKVSQAA